MLDSTTRLARASSSYSKRRRASSLAYRDRNVFRADCASTPVAGRARRKASPAVLAAQAEYRLKTGRRISQREAKALLAIQHANRRR